MRAFLFAFLIWLVAVVVSTIFRGQQASHDEPPFLAADAMHQKFLQHRTAMFVFELCALFAIDLAILAILYYFDLLSSSYRTMISLPTKDAAHPDDEAANKNEHPTTGKFDEGQCPICLDSPQIDKSFPPCGHTYCFDCLLRWCKTRKVCPTCNRRISFFYHDDGKMMCDLNQVPVQMRWKTVLKHHYLITSGRQVFSFLSYEYQRVIFILIYMDMMTSILFYSLIKYGFI